jgi:hypothetical protein
MQGAAAMTVSLAPALSQRAREMRSALRAPFGIALPILTMEFRL